MVCPPGRSTKSTAAPAQTSPAPIKACAYKGLAPGQAEARRLQPPALDLHRAALARAPDEVARDGERGHEPSELVELDVGVEEERDGARLPHQAPGEDQGHAEPER